MKNTTFLLLLSISIALMSCQKDEDPSPANVNNINTDLPSGEWKISYYFDKDKDETSDYASYNFSFKDNGSLTATSSNQTYNGTWNTTTDDGLPRLVIFITGNADLDELSDDWVVEKLTGTEIWLKDDNNTHIEELRFIKIN